MLSALWLAAALVCLPAQGPKERPTPERFGDGSDGDLVVSGITDVNADRYVTKGESLRGLGVESTFANDGGGGGGHMLAGGDGVPHNELSSGGAGGLPSGNVPSPASGGVGSVGHVAALEL